VISDTKYLESHEAGIHILNQLGQSDGIITPAVCAPPVTSGGPPCPPVPEQAAKAEIRQKLSAPLMVGGTVSHACEIDIVEIHVELEAASLWCKDMPGKLTYWQLTSNKLDGLGENVCHFCAGEVFKSGIVPGPIKLAHKSTFRDWGVLLPASFSLSGCGVSTALLDEWKITWLISLGQDAPDFKQSANMCLI
jgi:hypothetical protein